MQTRFSGRLAALVAGIFAALSAVASPAPAAEPALRAAVTIDGATRFQRIDGFGVNVTPAQWRGGALKPTLDLLVDDLGTSLVRLDCYGKADWLDPAARGADGHWPEAHLAGVYRSRVFAECWDTFRHLSAKGADVHLNVSGRIPAAWAGPDGQTLVDFGAYAEMAVSLARWAREKEGLRFATFAPFNETNLGFPEGPKVRDADVLPAVRAVAKRMDAAGLGDVKLVVACDAPPVAMERFAPMLEAPDLVGRVAASHAPKKRYFAAKQVYRFVRPGWRRVEVALPPRDPKDVYAGWHDPMRHLRLLAFTSPDGGEVTLVGMSRVEGDVALEVVLRGLAPGASGKALAYYRTTRVEDARLVETKEAPAGVVRMSIPEGSIFTLTTLRSARGPS